MAKQTWAEMRQQAIGIYDIYWIHKNELAKRWMTEADITEEFANEYWEYLDNDWWHCILWTIKRLEDEWYIILEIMVQARLLYWQEAFNQLKSWNEIVLSFNPNNDG